MKLPQQLRVSDLLEEIARLASHVHVRLALSEAEEATWVARSLVVDVFPQAWLAKPDDIFTEYQRPQFLREFPQRALFFAEMMETHVVSSWFSHPDICELGHFDTRRGWADRVLRFRMPEVHLDVTGARIDSKRQDGYAILPWPHFRYPCTLKEPNIYRPGDHEPLYAPGQGHFSDFREARAKLIHGMTDLNRGSYQDRDEVEIRVVDGDGWIREARKRGTSFDVSVGGLGLKPGHIILKCDGAEDEEKDIVGPGVATFVFQADPAVVDIILTNDTMQLDRARYVLSPSPITGASTPHVVIEPGPTDDHGVTDETATAGRINRPGKQVLRVVVASPRDVQRERDSLTEVAEELNEGIAGYLGLELKLWRWETDAYPGFHAGGAQGQIDEIMRIEDADIVIGTFWTRFGTPVADAQSGTEHELLRAYEAWKRQGHPRIMIYFKQQASKNVEAEQLLALQRFKQRFPSEGLWWAYPNSSKFPGIVRRHLTRLLLHEYARTE